MRIRRKSMFMILMAMLICVFVMPASASAAKMNTEECYDVYWQDTSAEGDWYLKESGMEQQQEVSGQSESEGKDHSSEKGQCSDQSEDWKEDLSV